MISKYKKYLESENIDDLEYFNDVEFNNDSFTLSGLTFSSEEYLYVGASGFDLGCGVSLAIITMKKDIKSFKELNCLMDLISKKEIKSIKYYDDGQFIGNIETGNHFIEIRRIMDSSALKLVGDAEKYIYALIIHSGSTEDMKMTNTIFFINTYKSIKLMNTNDNGYEVKIEVGDQQSDLFLSMMKESMEFAQLNRKYITNEICNTIGAEISHFIDSPHDFIENNNNTITHYFGIQKPQLLLNTKVALILSGAEDNNIVVECDTSVKAIDHGTKLISVVDGERCYSSSIADMLENNDKLKKFLTLEPYLSIKYIGDKYEYRFYKN